MRKIPPFAVIYVRDMLLSKNSSEQINHLENKEITKMPQTNKYKILSSKRIELELLET